MNKSLLKIKEDACLFLVREFVAPYASAISEQMAQIDSSNSRKIRRLGGFDRAQYLDKEQFFAMISRFHKRIDEELDAAVSTLRELELSPRGHTNETDEINKRNKQDIWTHLMFSIHRKITPMREAKERGAADVESDEDTSASTNKRTRLARPANLIHIEDLHTLIMGDFSGAVTTPHQRQLLHTILDYTEKSSERSDVITRVDFFVALKLAQYMACTSRYSAPYNIVEKHLDGRDPGDSTDDDEGESENDNTSNDSVGKDRNRVSKKERKKWSVLRVAIERQRDAITDGMKNDVAEESSFHPKTSSRNSIIKYIAERPYAEAVQIESVLRGAVPVEDEKIQASKSKAFTTLAKRTNKVSKINPDDYEPVVLHIFSAPKANPNIIRKLIDTTSERTIHNSFLTDYSLYKFKQAQDLHDLLAFTPFFLLFLIVVYSGRGLQPASYNGHGVYKGVTDVLEQSEFPSCSRNETTNELSCNGGTIKLSDINKLDNIYAAIHGYFPQILWPGAGRSAASTSVAGDLRPVGALKIRQQRVEALDTGFSNAFWNVPENGTAVNFSTIRRIEPYTQISLESIPTSFPVLSGNPAVVDAVLPPWDGSHHATCAQLNSTRFALGGDMQRSCSGFSIVVPFNKTREQYLGLATAMSELNWIDLQTRVLFFEYFLFHKSTAFIVAVKHVLEIHAGGGVSLRTYGGPFHFFEDASQGGSVLALYVIYFMYLCILVLHFIFMRSGLVVLERSVSSIGSKEGNGGRSFWSIGRSRAMALRQLSKSPWKILDAVNFGCFATTLVLRVSIWIGKGAPEDPVWQLTHFPAGFDLAFYAFDLILVVDAFCVILSLLLMFRFTKYFPRFDSIVQTLLRSIGPGQGLLFLTVVSVTVFAIAGHVVYGDVLLGVRSVPQAILLGVSSFWSNHEFRDYEPLRPIFSYFYVIAFNVVLIAFFLSAVVAVFSDAFADEQEAAFRPDSLYAILENNPHHLLQTYSLSRIVRGSVPYQLFFAGILQIKKIFLKYYDEDRYTFDAYHRRLMDDILILFQPEQITAEGFSTLPHPDDRIESCAELIRLISKFFIVPTTGNPRDVKGRNECTSIIDYAGSIFQSSLDFTLVLTLYVFVPQKKFKQLGSDLLFEVARSHKRWLEEIEARTMQVTEEQAKTMRYDVNVVRENELYGSYDEDDNVDEAGLDAMSENSYRSKSSIARLRTELKEKRALEFVNTLSFLQRRFLLGVIASAPQEHFADDAVLDEPRFCHMIEGVKDFPNHYDVLTPTQAYRELGVELWRSRHGNTHLLMKNLLLIAQDEFAVQCLGFKFSMGDVLRMDKSIRFMALSDEIEHRRISAAYAQEAKKRDRRTKRHDGRKLSVLTQKMDDTSSEMTVFTERGCEVTPHHVTVDAVEDTVEAALEHVLRVAETEGIELPADAYLLTPNEFKSAWNFTKGWYPSDEVVNRVLSIFPDGRIDAKLFLYFSRTDTLLHQCRSFHVEFARRMRSFSTFAIWWIFYFCVMSFVFFFALYGFRAEHVVRTSESLRISFAPDTRTLDDVHDWLSTVVDEAWESTSVSYDTMRNFSATAPSNKYRVHQNVNYFVGALRLRQTRVTADDAFCEVVHKTFFNNLPVVDPSMRSFYSSRIIHDFGSAHGSCFGAFNYGAHHDVYHRELNTNFTDAQLGVNVSLLPGVKSAFSFRDSGEYFTVAHDATFPSSGFLIDIPFLGTSKEDAKAVVDQLQKLNWIDQRTRFVVAEFATLNPNLMVYTHSTFGVEIGSGGAHYPVVKIRSTSAQKTSYTVIVWHSVLLWILILLYVGLFVDTIDDIVRARYQILRSTVRVVLDAMTMYPSFFTDISIMCLLIITWAWRLHWFFAAELVYSLHNDGRYPIHIEQRCFLHVEILRSLDGITILLVGLRFLYVLSVFRSFEVIFETIRIAFKDLVAITFFFVLSLLAFAISAQLLFGYYVNTFASLPLTYLDLLLVSFGSDSIFDDFAPVRPVAAPFFQIIFITVCSFLFYNLITAVLTGALSEVKQSLFDDTLPQNIIKKAKEDLAVERHNRTDEFSQTLRALCRSRGGFRKSTRPITSLRETAAATVSLHFQMILRSYALFQGLSHLTTLLRNYFLPLEEERVADGGVASNYSDAPQVDVPQMTPLSRNLFSYRRVWDVLSKLWSNVDDSPPQRAARAAMELMIIGAEVKANIQRIEQLRLEEAYAEEYEDPLFRPRHSPGTLVTGAGNGTGNSTRLHTYGNRRRLPLWHEYLFSKFQKDFSSFAFYLITVPTHLLLFPSSRWGSRADTITDRTAQWFDHSKENENMLWIDALENLHFFDAIRSQYELPKPEVESDEEEEDGDYDDDYDSDSETTDVPSRTDNDDDLDDEDESSDSSSKNDLHHQQTDIIDGILMGTNACEMSNGGASEQENSIASPSDEVIIFERTSHESDTDEACQDDRFIP